MKDDSSRRKRILVVEDESLIADLLEGLLDDMGYQVIGPAYNVHGGLQLVAANEIDCALLDVSLAGQKSFPIAAALAQRGVPFLFLTGYVKTDLPPEFGSCAVLGKPIMNEDLRAAVANLCCAGVD